MTPEMIIEVGYRAIELSTVLMLILLLPALVVGVVIGVLQAATQVNEATLSFVPKLLVTLAVLVFAGPMMLRLLTDYTERLFESIPGLIG